MLTSEEAAAVRQVAIILLPGDADAPAAASIAGLDELIRQAVVALGSEVEVLHRALAQLPVEIDWDALSTFADSNPDDFEIISTVAAGSYFLSPDALTAIGYPQGARKAARLDQAADEIGSGVLDLVMARESMVREVVA